MILSFVCISWQLLPVGFPYWSMYFLHLNFEGFLDHKRNQTCLSINRNGSCSYVSVDGWQHWVPLYSHNQVEVLVYSLQWDVLKWHIELLTISAQPFNACSPSVFLMNMGKIWDIYLQFQNSLATVITFCFRQLTTCA